MKAARGFLYGLALGLTLDRLAEIGAEHLGDHLKRRRALAVVTPITHGRLHR